MKKKSKSKAPRKQAGRKAALAVASGSALLWDSEYDDNDNTVLMAAGGSTDGESADLFYRLRQEVRNNMHVWVEASDPELMMDEEGPLRWHNKHDARRAIKRHHEAIMRSYASSQNTEISGRAESVERKS